MLGADSLASQTLRVVSHRWLARAAIIALVLAAAAAVLARTEADPDLWGHLRFGLDNLQVGSIARFDNYSYVTGGQPWINHEWLAEVIFAAAWTLGNVLGLTVLKLTVGVTVLVVLYRYLLKDTVRPITAGILLLLASVLLYPSLGSVRPQIFTVLSAALLLCCVLLAGEGRYRALWLLPLLFVAWANLHGGFLAGLVILLLWTLGQLVSQPKTWRLIVPPVVAGVLATFVNPYGPQLIVFLFKTATVARPEIIEWQPLALASLLGGLYLAAVAISVAGFIFSRRSRNIVQIALFGVLALMPLLALRHIPFMALGFILLAGPHILDAWDRWRGGKMAQDAPKTVLLYSSILGATGLAALAAIRLASIPYNLEWAFPVSAVRLLEDSGATANMAVDFNWGEYVIWHLGHQVKVSVDGRRETVYSSQAYTANLNFMFGVENWDAILANDQTDLALVDKRRAVFNLMRLKPGWVSVFEDDSSALFARRDFGQLPSLLRAAATFHPTSGPVYFP